MCFFCISISYFCINMRTPPHFYNPYNLQDLYEQYTKNCSQYSTFKSTFKTFTKYHTHYKKYLPHSIYYRHVIQLEGRKYHYLYN